MPRYDLKKLNALELAYDGPIPPGVLATAEIREDDRMSAWKAVKREHTWAVEAIEAIEALDGEPITVQYGDWLTEDSARLIAAACNSYRRHCGARAVECAEDDLLGLALDACRELRDAHGQLDAFERLYRASDKARAVLARVQKEKASCP